MNKFLENLEKEIVEEKKTVAGWYKHNIYYPTKNVVNRIIMFFKWDIPSFIQRGKRGWADRDCWCMDHYLAKVIDETTMYLINNKQGYPRELSERKWADILIRINDTFHLAKRVSDGDIILTKTIKQYNQFKRLYKTDDTMRMKIFTPKETKDFYAGFDLFKKYFFNLWD